MYGVRSWPPQFQVAESSTICDKVFPPEQSNARPGHPGPGSLSKRKRRDSGSHGRPGSAPQNADDRSMALPPGHTQGGRPLPFCVRLAAISSKTATAVTWPDLAAVIRGVNSFRPQVLQSAP